MVADGANAVKESYESNNSRSQSLYIAPTKNVNIGGVSFMEAGSLVYDLDEYKDDGNTSEYDKFLPAAAKPKKIGLRLKILLFILIVLTNFAVTLFACNIKLEEIVITLRSNNNFMKNQYQMSSD